MLVVGVADCETQGSAELMVMENCEDINAS